MNLLINLIPQDFPAFLDALRDTLVEAFLADFLGAFFLADFLIALRDRFLALFQHQSIRYSSLKADQAVIFATIFYPVSGNRCLF